MIRLEKYPDVGEGCLLLVPFKPISIGQGTWLRENSNLSALFTQFYNTTNANADNCSFNVFLARGTYTLTLLYNGGDNRGICDIDIDGVEVGSVDMYNAAPLNSELVEQTGVVITKSGLKTIRFRSDGKNGASSGYIIMFSLLQFMRTA